MSEYWKSTPKYWCKHCSSYVKDTHFERKQHESTAKHQNNLKRFLRDIQNSHERGEREKDRAKSEVERLKGVAGGDTKTSSSPSQPASKPTSSTQRPTTGPPSIADRKRQWAQLAEMGVKVPAGFRSEMAMSGDWQTLSQQVVDEPSSEAPLSKGVKKRKYEDQEQDDEEKQAAGEAVVRRGWGATTKTYPGHGNADLDDLLSNSISFKKEKPGFSDSQINGHNAASLEQDSNPVLNHDRSQGGVEHHPHDSAIKSELVKEEPDLAEASQPMAQMPEEVSVPVFRKRKAKAS